MKKNIPKITTQQKREQLRWFVNKLIFFCKQPRQDNRLTYFEGLYFPLNCMKESNLFELGGLDEQGYPYESDYHEFATYAENMLQKIKSDIYKINDAGFQFDSKKFYWFEDETVSYSPRYSRGFFIDIYFKPLFEAYLTFMDNNEKVSSGREKSAIEKIEILEDKKEQGRIYVYINGDYNDPRDFSRGKRWSKLYELASGKDILFDKDVFDYFNYHPSNPLYTEKGGFKVTSVLKEEDGYLVPNIEIILTTQNKITRQLKTLKKR
jgi:hypothetical protein